MKNTHRLKIIIIPILCIAIILLRNQIIYMTFPEGKEKGTSKKGRRRER